MRHGRSTQWFLWAILLLHLGLSLAYGVVVPLSEAPDELSHYDYVRLVVRERRLPVATEVGEAIQPPLYYILGAALAWPIPMDLDFARSNPAFRLHDPDAPQNLFVHGRAETFPYRGSALAFHLVRALSAVLSTLTVWAVYRGLLLLARGDQVAALGGAGFLAFVPEFCYLGGAAQNDNLAALLAACLLWRLLALVRGRGDWAAWAQVGVLLGLGLLAKLSLVAFLPLVGLVAAWRAWRMRGSGLARSAAMEAARLGGALALAAAIAGWWYVRNVRLYGDPLGWALIRRAVDLQRCPWTREGVWWMLRGLFESFWGRFGGAAHVRLPLWAYLLAAGFSAVALVGAARGLLSWWRAGRPGWAEAAGWGLVVLWLGMVGASLVRYTLTAQGTNQARLLYPALLPLVGVLWMGFLHWFPRRRWPWVGGGVAGLLALANLALLAWFLPAHYGVPRPPAPMEASLPAEPLAVFGGEIALLEARLEPQEVDAQGQVEVRLVWQALTDIQEDYRVSLWVQGPPGVPPWVVKGAPAGGRHPTDLWHAAQV
ncbi:MAG: phospholipid carrier-dependent glycosyltransferase, partial [Anaerolineae bacterium]|nr:phospholipid carrier-dependent glycosyltransferase [Anaerolineae bacterium]